MPLIEPHIPKSLNGRRRFGVAVACGLVLLGLLLTRFGFVAGWGLWIVAGVWTFLFFLWPSHQPTMIRGWQRVTWPLAWGLGHTLLLLVYFGVLYPIGLLRRRSRGALRLAGKRGGSTWRSKRPPTDESYFRQF